MPNVRRLIKIKLTLTKIGFLRNVSFHLFYFDNFKREKKLIWHRWTGADPEFMPVVTSYDYDAPISESGNLTEKYYAIKSVIAEVRSTCVS